jgi:TatD DNase family protein
MRLLLQRAEEAGVSYFLCVGIDLENSHKVLAIAKQFSNVFATIGLHPNEMVNQEPTVDELIELGTNAKVIGIGETGLDYYRSEGDNTWQQERFRHHIRAAKYLNKPLIVHSRQARKDTIDILKEEQASEVGGIMHCFTEDWAMAKQALDLNFYISFSGIITFKNAEDLREVVKNVPIEKMLIETDAPYLAPVPFRGKPNEPAYVRYVALQIAEIKKMDFATVAEQTTKNFFRLFKIQK